MLIPFLLALAQAPATDAAPKPIESLPPLVEDAQAVSPDHKLIAVSTTDEGVWVLDIATKTVGFRVAPTTSVVDYVTWSNDGTKLGLLHRNADIEIVDAATGSVTTKMGSASKNPVEWDKREIHFAAGGTVIVAALGGPPTEILSVVDGRSIAQLSTESDCRVTAMALSPDDGLLAQGDLSGVVSFWKPPTGERLDGEVRIRNDKRVQDGSAWDAFRGIHSLAFDRSGDMLAIGGGDCAAHLWCRSQKRVVRTFSTCHEEVFSTLGIGSVAFSPDGSRLLTSTFPYVELRVWDLPTDHLLDRGCVMESHSSPVSAWFSCDGERIVLGAGASSRKYDDRHPVSKSHLSELFSQSMQGMLTPPFGLTWWRHEGDYAWAVVDHHLVVRKIPDAEPVMRIPVREK